MCWRDIPAKEDKYAQESSKGYTVSVCWELKRKFWIKAIPRPEKIAPKEFAPAAEELFDRIMQIADNAGATDEHRALNYCALRYQVIHATAADAFARNESRFGPRL